MHIMTLSLWINLEGWVKKPPEVLEYFREMSAVSRESDCWEKSLRDVKMLFREEKVAQKLTREGLRGA